MSITCAVLSNLNYIDGVATNNLSTFNKLFLTKKNQTLSRLIESLPSPNKAAICLKPGVMSLRFDVIVVTADQR